MAKTRRAHSFRPQVRQGPTSVAGPSTAGPAAAGPSADFVAVGPSTAAASADPSVPAARPTAAPTLATGDAEGSSSVAPTQRRYHTRVGLTPPAPHILGQPEGPHRLRGPELQAQGSHLHRDPRRRPIHLIRVFPEPWTYLRGPSSGGLTSRATPSRGMLAARIDISMGRCTTISPHLPRT